MNRFDSTSAHELSGARVLIILSLLHFVVDTVATQLNPLWPTLEKHYQLGEGSTFWMLLVWTLVTSFFQLFFGMIGDGPTGRWLMWIGPMAGAICLGCIGLSSMSPILIGLLVVGGLGIAAFHPEGATLAGSCWPRSRSRAMSIFATGGFLGQSFGPALSGWVVDHHGLSGLRWGIGIGLMAICGLRLAYRDPRSAEPPIRAMIPIRPWSVLNENRSVVGLLLLIGTLRVVAASGAPITVAYWLTARQATSGEIGTVQSAFLFGIGLGGLLCASAVRPRTERFALWSFPLLAVPCLLATPQASGIWLLVAMFGSGLGIGIAQPVFISFGQQLLPTSQRIGSSLTMGVCWGTGGIVAAAVVDQCDRHQSFDAAFVGFAVCVMVSSVVCAWLPKVRDGRDGAIH